ncbi:proline dehydrogenase-like protein [Hortaea werneckii]|nr:proline dehydrogenase-like protein [Hortaea werneckii]KAI7680779.1 proline dehydrogenase-like protein [Hortaea werneckii]
MKPVAIRLEGGLLQATTARHTTPACSSILSPHITTQSASRRRRQIHSSPSGRQHATILDSSNTPSPPPAAPTVKEPAKSGPDSTPALGCLPLGQILRSYLITSVSSSPALLEASSKLLRQMLESKNFLFSLERNPIARALLHETFYKQFCAGSTKQEVSKTTTELRQMGYSGVILEYALEVLKDAEGDEAVDVETWREGMLSSVHMADRGDFLGLKWSGMGVAAMNRMKKNEQPSKQMSEAMHAVCQAAAAKDISLLPAAEETWSLDGFHQWCLDLQRQYNTAGKSVVYSTYQAYLKQTPETVARHLQIAKDEGFTLGLKLVRGAYLGTEARSLIWDTIEGTHTSYDTIASALIHRRDNELVRPFNKSSGEGFWPSTNVMLATHNAVSVRLAQEHRRAQAARGEELTTLTFAQLQGMADEVSTSLIAAARASEQERQALGLSQEENFKRGAVKEKVFKCTTWGTMHQCLNYLLRRAAENKDAASRTKDTRLAMGAELRRRVKATFGLA